MLEPRYEVAIVGAGPGGLIAFATLRYGGLPAGRIVVVDEEGTPLAGWLRSTGAIRQELMRSESDGHFFATDYPGFALIDAIQRRSPLPLLQSAVNRYTPRRVDILRHGRALAQRSGMDRRVERGRVDRIVRVEEPEPHFELRDDVGSVLARARHVLLALGHARWAWPAAVEDGALREALAGILYHAYQPKPPDAGSVLVIGSGLAAATEWMNALASGGHVVALRRKPSLLLQALSAPRCAFAGPWLDRYHSLDADSRLAALADISQGSFPRTWTAQRLLRRAEREGRLVMRIGDLSGLERTGDGRAVATVRAADGSVEQMEIDRVLAATGFSAAAAEYGVVRRAIEEYSLATRGGFLVLSDDCLVPALSREGSVLAVSGPLARWAFPAGDSFAGLKYAARRFAARVLARGLGGPGSVPAWLRMVHAGWPRRTGRVEDEVCATP